LVNWARYYREYEHFALGCVAPGSNKMALKGAKTPITSDSTTDLRNKRILGFKSVRGLCEQNFLILFSLFSNTFRIFIKKWSISLNGGQQRWWAQNT